MDIQKLVTQERNAMGATHKICVDYTDLTEDTANTAQTLEALGLGSVKSVLVSVVGLKLKTPFADASDAAFNSVTVVVGDGADTDRFVTSTQVNANGSYVSLKPGTTTVKAFAAEDTVDLVFSSMTAKALADLDAGELEVFVKVIELV